MKRTQNPTHWKIIRTLFLPILAGMVTAQLIATLFVYRSNLQIHQMTQAAEQAGYFVIPAGSVTATLTQLESAIWGGLFYTLSIGVGLTLTSWAFINLWNLVFKRNRRVLAFYLVLVAGLTVWINWQGLVLFPTLFCLLVPAVTALAVPAVKRPSNTPRDYYWIAPIAILVLMTGVWSSQLSGQLFTTIRDHILLSNPVGSAVNNFYYRYTLYAAESFKSLNQRTVRSYQMTSIPDPNVAKILPRLLSRSDMLHLPDLNVHDFTITMQGRRLIATTANGHQIERPVKQFLAKPQAWLQELSDASDCYAPLRRLTLICLLMGFPILLYVVCYGAIRVAAGTWLDDRTATLTSSLLCLIIGVLLFIPMLGRHSIPLSKETLSEALASDQWVHRVAALKHIEAKKIDIGHYTQYKPLLVSDRVVERYWLARVMAFSRLPDTYVDLTAMLNDPHPNVRCQVYYALGHRGQRSAITAIQSRIAASDHWYAQWYGYRALRRLGWFPNPSN